MSDFDALLKRSFAEIAEPVDDGFSSAVARSVSVRERTIEARKAIFGVAWAAAGAAVLYGLYSAAGAFGQDVMAVAGLEVARAHSALSDAPSVSGATASLLQSLSVGTMQVVLMTAAALAGGAVAYRAAQD